MYSEADRRIFGPYFDGRASRWGDPLAIDRRLRSALGGDPGPAISRYHEDAESQEAVLAAARIALELAPFDPATGAGALDLDAETALRSYLEWMEGKGERAASFPISSDATQEPSRPSSPPASITWPSSASG